MHEEINALHGNDSWDLVELPSIRMSFLVGG